MNSQERGGRLIERRLHTVSPVAVIADRALNGSMAGRGRQRIGFSISVLGLLFQGVVFLLLVEASDASDFKDDCDKYWHGSGSGSGIRPKDDVDYGDNADDEDAKISRCQAGAKNCDDNSITDSELYRRCKDEQAKAQGISTAAWSKDKVGVPHPLASQTTPPSTDQNLSAVKQGYKSTWENPAIITAICLGVFFGIIASVLFAVVIIHYRRHNKRRLLSDSVYV